MHVILIIIFSIQNWRKKEIYNILNCKYNILLKVFPEYLKKDIKIYFDQNKINIVKIPRKVIGKIWKNAESRDLNKLTTPVHSRLDPLHKI